MKHGDYIKLYLKVLISCLKNNTVCCHPKIYKKTKDIEIQMFGF